MKLKECADVEVCLHNAFIEVNKKADILEQQVKNRTRELSCRREQHSAPEGCSRAGGGESQVLTRIPQGSSFRGQKRHTHIEVSEKAVNGRCDVKTAEMVLGKG